MPMCRVRPPSAPIMVEVRIVDEPQTNEQVRLPYQGVFADGKAYGAGDFVTHSGSLWHANIDTTERPGAGGDWTLAVKRGRDAK